MQTRDNFFKTLLKDANELPKFQFACKYVFPLAAAFMSWGAIANYYSLTFETTNLNKHTGIVNSIQVIEEIGYTQYQSIKYFPVEISLHNSTKLFRLRENFSKYFNKLQSEIEKGDTVTIYTRTKFEALVGWGKQLDIYQIEKKGEILLPLGAVREYNKNQASALAIFSIILWAPFVLYILRR
jgi:hypothetical protein